MLWGVVLNFNSVNETIACCPTNGGILEYSMLNCSLHEFCFRLIQNENRLQNWKSSSNIHPSTQHSSTMVKPSFLTWRGVRNRLALCCFSTISSASAIAKRRENLFWDIVTKLPFMQIKGRFNKLAEFRKKASLVPRAFPWFRRPWAWGYQKVCKVSSLLIGGNGVRTKSALKLIVRPGISYLSLLSNNCYSEVL